MRFFLMLCFFLSVLLVQNTFAGTTPTQLLAEAEHSLGEAVFALQEVQFQSDAPKTLNYEQALETLRVLQVQLQISLQEQSMF